MLVSDTSSDQGEHVRAHIRKLLQQLTERQRAEREAKTSTQKRVEPDREQERS